LYEVGDEQGQLFLVCEFVPGQSLRTVTGGRPMNPRRAIDLAVQIGDALADAHALGIVHRDIRPDNIIVTPKGNAKILDCGLAAWTGSDAEREQVAGAAQAAATPEGAASPIPGTAAYMSPEQALGEQVDHRTDIFSLGTVLFEMLTGALPFAGTTSSALALQIVQATAPVPSSVRKSLPRELDVIVGKALAKSLDQRYEAAATLAAELRSVAAILDVRSEASEPADTLVALQGPERSYAGWLVAAIALAALGVAAWVERGALQAWFGR
jgi:serine/threonine protein kinase